MEALRTGLGGINNPISNWWWNLAKGIGQGYSISLSAGPVHEKHPKRRASEIWLAILYTQLHIGAHMLYLSVRHPRWLFYIKMLINCILKLHNISALYKRLFFFFFFYKHSNVFQSTTKSVHCWSRLFLHSDTFICCVYMLKNINSCHIHMLNLFLMSCSHYVEGRNKLPLGPDSAIRQLNSPGIKIRITNTTFLMFYNLAI